MIELDWTKLHKQAVKEIQDANENWDLMGFDTTEDVIDYMQDETVETGV